MEGSGVGGSISGAAVDGRLSAVGEAAMGTSGGFSVVPLQAVAIAANKIRWKMEVVFLDMVGILGLIRQWLVSLILICSGKYFTEL